MSVAFSRTVALSEVDIYVVPTRLLSRLIRRLHHLRGLAIGAPHDTSYSTTISALRGLPPDRGLPLEGISLGGAPDRPVTLIASGDVDTPVALTTYLARNGGPPKLASHDGVLTRRQLLQRLFHEAVHQTLLRRQREGTFTRALAVQRLHRLGQVEVEELRSVLRHDDRLLPTTVETRPGVLYGEIAAHLLTCWHFEPARLQVSFPVLAGNLERTLRVLRLDFDDEALKHEAICLVCPELDYADCTPPEGEGVTEDGKERVPTPRGSPASWRRAQWTAERKGNLARAAIANAVLSRPGQTTEALVTFATKLRDALLASGPTDSDDASWEALLQPLMLPAAAGFAAQEAKLLFDLQRAALDASGELHRVDLVEWCLSLGRRSIVRPLPSLPPLLALRHVRRALGRVELIRTGSAHRERLRHQLEALVTTLEGNARERFTPIVEGAVDAALPAITDDDGEGLLARRDRLGRSVVVDEVVDRLLAKGRLIMTDVRDAFARNEAKLADVGFPVEMLRGDTILRIDRELSPQLEGAYRRGEVYRRFLHRVTASLFGTKAGRLFSRWGLFPFGGAFFALEGLTHMVGLASAALGGGHPHLVSWWSVIATGVLLATLINSRAARKATAKAFRGVGRALRTVFVDSWLRVWRHPRVQALLDSRGWRLIVRLLLAPGLLTSPVAVAVFGYTSWPRAPAWALVVATFVTMALLANSRLGFSLRDWSLRTLVRFGRLLRRHLVVGLIRWILAVFRRLLWAVERVLYTVDEWLRFRPGSPPWVKAPKAVVGLVWALFAYVVRFYVNVLLEPKYNPVKHFPAVTVGHKIILPMAVPLTRALAVPLAPLGSVAANTIAGITVFLIPGLFGFLAWELKESWKLYRANQSGVIKPVRVASHGETMVRLLRPGFHSGTLPKQFRKLRKAHRKSGLLQRRKINRAKAYLHHIREEAHRFATRHLCRPLNADPDWGSDDVRAEELRMASNRITAPLRVREDLLGTLRFERESGWILGWFEPGPAFPKDTEARSAFDTALRDCYAKAGVDFVREDVEQLLPEGASYDFAEAGLVVWPTEDFSVEALYQLSRDAGLLVPVNTLGGAEATGLVPTFESDALFFGPRVFEGE